MQLRTIALICSIVSGLLFSGFASALGLGEITLKSQFNQPLNAEIRLLKVRDLSEEEILVELASREDFRRSGVERVFFLTGLRFEVVLDNPSNPFVRITTSKPVTEPYLDFLIQVQWPSGRLLREYTLLMDLPTFNTAAPAPAVTAPSSSNNVVSTPAQPSPVVRSSQPQPRVNSTPPPQPQQRPQQQTSAQSPVDSYRVRSGDTLWEIAERVRPDSTVSVNQTMIAIQQANPGAFINGNINRLRNGRVLRVPASGEIANISYNQAVAAVRQQNQSWSSESNQRAVLTSSDVASSTTSPSSQPEGRLTLGSADAGQSDVRSAGASGAGASLQKDLTAAKEELDRSQRENSELQARVSELEAQIDTMEKLVEVTNDQLRALQLAVESNANASQDPSSAQDAAVPPVGGETVQPAPDSDTNIATTPDQGTDVTTDPVSPGLDPISPPIEPSITEPDVAVTPEPAPQPAPVPAPPVQQPEPGFNIVEFIQRNLLAIGGGLIALIIAALALWKLREKPEETDFDDFELDEEDDMFAADEAGDQTVLDDEDDYIEEEDEELVEAQTEDVVAEADIYVSLGQEDKAIELLQQEIQQNPDNADARLGLLKIYANAQNAAAFDEQYAQLLPLGNVYANDQATALRKDISDIDPFDTDQYSLEDETAEALSDGLELSDESSEELDLDLSLDDDLSSSEFASAELDSNLSADDEELDLDLGDLSLDLDGLSEDLNELDISGDSPEEALELSVDGDLSFDELDDDLQLDLDEEFTGDLGADTLDLDSEISSDLSSLDIGDIDEKILEEGDVTELDLDISDEFESTLGDLEVDDDLSSSLDEAIASSEELEFDLDLESAESAISSDDLDSIDGPEYDLETDLNIGSIDGELDLDTPPPEDLDIASLDQEIDAMTAELDEVLPLDMPEEVLEESSEESVLDESVEVEPLDAVDELESLEISDSDIESLADDDHSDDLEALASSELESLEDPIGTQLEVPAAIDDTDLTSELVGEDSSIMSADDEITIEEDDELDFLEESDEVSTKLDLAKAYLDMGDREGAEDILGEVMEEGNSQQKDEAQELMRKI